LLNDLFTERFGKARPVDRMDGVKQRDGILGLVRLKRSDEMQFQVLVPGRERRPLRPRFLNAVFPKHALTFGNDRLDRLGGEGF
jgi:hypothetical protein